MDLVFRSFSEGTLSYVAIDLLCLWEEGSSVSSYTAILNHLPLSIYLLNNQCAEIQSIQYLQCIPKYDGCLKEKPCVTELGAGLGPFS